ncbi:hypothetical protein [Hymenobacter canadensis]
MGQGIREFKAASKEPQPEYRDRPAAPGAPINPNAPINPTNPNQPQA